MLDEAQHGEHDYANVNSEPFCTVDTPRSITYTTRTALYHMATEKEKPLCISLHRQFIKNLDVVCYVMYMMTDIVDCDRDGGG